MTESTVLKNEVSEKVETEWLSVRASKWLQTSVIKCMVEPW